MTLDEAKTELSQASAAAEVIAAAAAEREATTTGQIEKLFGSCADTRSTLDALKRTVVELSKRLEPIELLVASSRPKPVASEPAPEVATAPAPEPASETTPDPS